MPTIKALLFTLIVAGVILLGACNDADPEVIQATWVADDIYDVSIGDTSGGGGLRTIRMTLTTPDRDCPPITELRFYALPDTPGGGSR